MYRELVRLAPSDGFNTAMSNTRTTNRAARGGMRNESEDPETQQLWEQIKDMMRDHDAVAEKIKANNARILSAEAGWMVKGKNPARKVYSTLTDSVNQQRRKFL